MSKWSKRSPEDKARILAEREALQKAMVEKSPEYQYSPEKQSEIIKQQEMPLVCPNHGYTKSERYEIVTEKHPLLDQEVSMVLGKCPICGAMARRALTLSEAGMVFALVLQLLASQGRLVDNRKVRD